MAENKRTETPAARASRTAPLDLSAHTIEDSDTPTRAGNSAAPDPAMLAAIRSSAESKTNRPTADNANAWVGKGKALTVPRQHVPTVVAMLRHAAESEGYGATFAYYVKGAQAKPADVLGISKSRDGKRAAVEPTVPATTQVQIRFAAKSPKQRRAKPANS